MSLLAAVLAATLELHADPAHTTATFAVKHLMVTTVRGEFGKTRAKLNGETRAWRARVARS